VQGTLLNSLSFLSIRKAVKKPQEDRKELFKMWVNERRDRYFIKLKHK